MTVVRWSYTQKGNDTFPILTGIIACRFKWYPDVVFANRIPRTLGELFTTREAEQIIKDYA
jgi:hypothetical protein